MKKRTDQEFIEAFIAEIKRIYEHITYPYAPTMGMYRKHRLKGIAPTHKTLRRLGYGLSASEWKRFVKEHTGLIVESQNAINARRGKSISQSKLAYSETGKTDKFTNGIQHGELDILPPPGMEVSSVRVDVHGNQWCLLR